MRDQGEHDEERDAEIWDRQIEADVRAGKLDAMADATLMAWKQRKTSPIAIGGKSISRTIIEDSGE